LRLARPAAWLAAFLVAVLAAMILLALPPPIGIGDKCLLAPAFVAILGYAIVAGLPTAAILFWRRWSHPVAAAAAGFALGALPAVMFGWPHLAFMGAVGAGVFWAALKFCGTLPADAVRPRLSLAIAGAAIVLIVVAVEILSTLPSCGDVTGR
jgi:uncharacterized membrane protein YeaQ/YmgE (transglycosylase-associated protein family)